MDRPEDWETHSMRTQRLRKPEPFLSMLKILILSVSEPCSKHIYCRLCHVSFPGLTIKPLCREAATWHHPLFLQPSAGWKTRRKVTECKQKNHRLTWAQGVHPCTAVWSWRACSCLPEEILLLWWQEGKPWCKCQMLGTSITAHFLMDQIHSWLQRHQFCYPRCKTQQDQKEPGWLQLKGKISREHSTAPCLGTDKSRKMLKGQDCV